MENSFASKGHTFYYQDCGVYILLPINVFHLKSLFQLQVVEFAFVFVLLRLSSHARVAFWPV